MIFLLSLGNGLLFLLQGRILARARKTPDFFYFYSYYTLILIMIMIMIMIVRLLGSQGSIMTLHSSLILRGSIGVGVGGK